MENNADSYVLVLEDRSRVQSPTEAGHLSVVSSMDEAGRVKTVEPTEANQTAFMKFKKNDSVLKNFLSNLVKQFKDPTHFGVYRLVSDRAVESVAELRNMLAGREEPQNKAMLESIRMNLDEFAPAQKVPAIDESKVDWKELERLGLSRDRLEQSGDLNKLLNWQKTGLVGISVPFGETSIYTEARIALRQSEDGSLGLAIHSIRKEPQLDFPYMGYRFSEDEKATLLHSGNLGKQVELTPKNGEPFKGYVSIDPLTNELVALRADRVIIPQEIKSVLLTEQQHRDLTEGKPVKVEGMLSRGGKPFDATLQVNAEKRGIEFIFNDNLSFKERRQLSQKPQADSPYGVPATLCKYQLTERQQKALSEGRTLYLKNMVDKEGEIFSAYVRYDKEQQRPRFYRYNPDQKQEQVEAVAEGHKTQVAVNNEGKTNEATRHVKEPLKSGQVRPAEKQQAKQESEEQKQPRKRGRRM